MGMSASQARLLSLTARQSNLEFEGQQINQQRTNLSNQSANYYNSLLTMTVPTPPSTDDYTTIKYSFVIGGNDATVAKVLPQDKLGNYLVSYTTNLTSIGVQENTAYKITASANHSAVKTGKATVITDNTNVFDAKKQYYVLSFREDDDHGNLTALTNTSERYDKARINADNVKFFDKFGSEVNAYDATDWSVKSGFAVKYFDKDGNEVTDKDDAYENGHLKAGYKIQFIKSDDNSEVSMKEAAEINGLKDNYTAVVDKESDEIGYSLVSIQLVDRSSYEQALNDRCQIVTEFVENTIDTPDDKKGTDTIQTYAASNDATFSTVGSEYKEAFINAGLDINQYYQYKASTGIRFAKRDDVEKSANNSTLTITTFAVASMTKTQTTQLSGVQIEFDPSGRISTMTDADGNTYSMVASTQTDDAAYEDAYNQYTYDQYVYDQKQNEINAHIEILQAQDKNLELRLSQLNTEHNAIQTEMDAVNKVLSKNIETSFKTFNA